MIKFSNGLKYVNKTNKITTHKNRGMGFEDLINRSNAFYRANKIAIIYKKPTPIHIIKTELINGKYCIKDAVFERPSTTDYNGIYKGKYIDFEAKETNSLTSFPFNNIHANQIQHIFDVIDQGGIGFILISFKKMNEVYLLFGDKLRELYSGKRKSISYETLKKEGLKVPSSISVPIDYLSLLDL